ncbi:response regulator [Maribacter litoralis]|uniref:response regulator n=1 Tax=Maribacter litoralis TaxID=2059726 RepID=UPI003F5CBCEE
MKQKSRILVVDDYPMTVAGYKMCLKELEENFNLLIDGSNTCDEVLFKMKVNKKSFYEIILLDLNIPGSKYTDISGGWELAQEIRLKFPQTKILFHTASNDQVLILNLIEKLEPEGFLIKTDITITVLFDAVQSLIDNKSYFSESVKKITNSRQYLNYKLDFLDSKILYYISIGQKMKNLPAFIPLSMATIERRKKKLKLYLNLDDRSDKELIRVAKLKGLM